MKNTEKILCGDYNCILDVSKDHKGSKYNNDKAAKLINTYIEEYEMLDIWQCLNPEEKNTRI